MSGLLPLLLLPDEEPPPPAPRPNCSAICLMVGSDMSVFMSGICRRSTLSAGPFVCKLRTSGGTHPAALSEALGHLPEHRVLHQALESAVLSHVIVKSAGTNTWACTERAEHSRPSSAALPA